VIFQSKIVTLEKYTFLRIVINLVLYIKTHNPPLNIWNVIDTNIKNFLLFVKTSYLAINGHLLCVVFEDCWFVALRKDPGDEDIAQTSFPDRTVTNNNDLDFRRGIQSVRWHPRLHFHSNSLFHKRHIQSLSWDIFLVEAISYLKIFKLRYWLPFSYRPFRNSLGKRITLLKIISILEMTKLFNFFNDYLYSFYST